MDFFNQVGNFFEDVGKSAVNVVTAPVSVIRGKQFFEPEDFNSDFMRKTAGINKKINSWGGKGIIAAGTAGLGIIGADKIKKSGAMKQLNSGLGGIENLTDGIINKEDGLGGILDIFGGVFGGGGSTSGSGAGGNSSSGSGSNGQIGGQSTGTSPLPKIALAAGAAKVLGII
jgi:hypothetical protein